MTTKQKVTNLQTIDKIKSGILDVGDYVYVKVISTFFPSQSYRFHGKVQRVDNGVMYLHTGATCRFKDVSFYEPSGDPFPISNKKRAEWILGDN